MIRVAVLEADMVQAGCLLDAIRTVSDQYGLALQPELLPVSGMPAAAAAYDAIVLDAALEKPDWTAYAAAAEQKSPAVPILLITQPADFVLRSYGLHAAATIQKPISAENLAPALKAMCAPLAFPRCDMLLLPAKGAKVRVPLADVLWVRRSFGTLTFFTRQQRYAVHTGRRALWKKLRGLGFAACRRDTLVQLTRVESRRGESLTVGPMQLALAPAYEQAFFDALAAEGI